jgi:hypothetical protein
MTAPSAANAFESGRVRENPLQIGGQFYLRGYANGALNTPMSQTPVSFPTIVDGYLDARPTDRIRAMVLARMSFDPFLQTTFHGVALSSTPPANPSVALDQAWLSFDIEHQVFVTAGRQHVKWGTGHFFSPCDFLAASHRDPLAQFDTRLGVSMVRAVVPVESFGWNFTGVALFEPTQQAGGLGAGGSSGSSVGDVVQSTSTTATVPIQTLGYVGGAARAEFTLGNAVVGIDGLIQKSRKPRAGLDFSAPLGPLDIYGEGLIISGSDYDLVTQRPTPDVSQYARGGLGQVFYSTSPNNPGYITPGVVAGAGYTFAFQDNKSVILGAEYFYNGAGYPSATVYPGLILTGNYQPFYNGKQYLAVNATLTNPTAKTTYSLSNIGNLSDGSYIARLDFSVIVLSYLTVEAFGDYHYGHVGGELRFAFSASEVGGVALPAGAFIPTIEAPTFDVGFGLRVAM